MEQLSWQVENVDDSALFAEKFAVAISHYMGRTDNLIICLVGPLGSGKTTLTRMICQSLGIKLDSISSPTFSIQNTYALERKSLQQIPKWVNHFDLYRISDEDELLETGIEEVLDSPGIHFIEWADRFPEIIPAMALTISMTPISRDQRKIRLSGCTTTFLQELDSLLSKGSQGLEP